ncbi:MAG: fumarylacetoacetate hydrolase family protein [Deltaproteobacteria bacterium]|nr:fumarylacetoacetate hydrolase family protein [Deltaproteobacteria bacterium]
MKLARFLKHGLIKYGVVEGEDVVEIEGGIFENFKKTSISHKLSDVKLLAPCKPSKIVAIGLNYKAHAAEFNKPLPEEPMLFMKPSTAVIGNGDEIIYPHHMSHRIDYEGELAVVIGKKAHMVKKEAARKYILGYTCCNDVTARDLQGKDIQYTRAKGFDTFAPLGPWIETDLNPLNVQIETYLNNEKRQDTSTHDMIFDVYHLISFVSCVMTLLPGDVITTGTPSGIGKMKPGDKVEVRIEGIGSLVNTVISYQ